VHGLNHFRPQKNIQSCLDILLADELESKQVQIKKKKKKKKKKIKIKKN
jgi:hypothetical protein